MNTINQICAFMENRPGQLAEILTILSGNNINLRALNVAETEDYGILRIITDDSSATEKCLTEEGFIVSVNSVFAIAVDDRPGGLNKLLNKLAGDGVDIEYMYSIFRYEAGKAYMIISAKDMELMAQSLEKHNIESATNETFNIR